MTLQPDELRQPQLRRRFRSHNRDAAHRVLEQVAESYEAIARERDELAQRVAELDQELVEFRGREHLISETLLVATRRAEQAKEEAERGAATILENARKDAGRIVQEAADRRARSEEATEQLERLAELTRTRLTTFLSETLEKLHRELKDDGKDGEPAAQEREQAPLVDPSSRAAPASGHRASRCYLDRGGACRGAPGSSARREQPRLLSPDPVRLIEDARDGEQTGSVASRRSGPGSNQGALPGAVVRVPGPAKV